MKIYQLTEGQTGVRLDYRDLPDLDDLMLEIWQDVDDESGYRYGDDIEDHPTVLSGSPEPEWQWVKISPCFCGEHGWHWDSRSATQWPKRWLDAGTVGGEPDMLADRPRGKFIAMYWD